MQDIMADSEVHTIKEVSLIVDEEQHVLRYWEREFAFLNPQKNEAGNRIYTSVDLGIEAIDQNGKENHTGSKESFS
jgi:DNA-binding transcriptional MerR regulator